MNTLVFSSEGVPLGQTDPFAKGIPSGRPLRHLTLYPLFS